MAIADVLERIRSRPVPDNEEATKMACVVPILQELGWDITDPSQVQFEHKVATKPLGKVDIALVAPRGRKLAFLEVKAPGQKLSNHVSQALGYAFFGGVDICAITTGIEWWLYLPREEGDPNQRRFATLNVMEDPVDQLDDDLQHFLAKEQLTSRSALRRARQVLVTKNNHARLAVEIPKTWRNMCREPDQDLVRLVEKRVFERVRLRPSHGQIAAVLRGGDVPASTEPAPPVLPPEKRPRRPTGYLLWNVRHQAKFYTDVLQGVATALYKKHLHDFSRALELRGRKMAWIARDPSEFATRPDGTPRGFREIGHSPYFIYVSLSGAACEKRAKKLLKHFGHQASDLEILFD